MINKLNIKELLEDSKVYNNIGRQAYINLEFNLEKFYYTTYDFYKYCIYDKVHYSDGFNNYCYKLKGYIFALYNCQIISNDVYDTMYHNINNMEYDIFSEFTIDGTRRVNHDTQRNT